MDQDKIESLILEMHGDIKAVKTQVESINKQLPDLQTRVTALEKGSSYFMGIGVVISFVISSVVSLFK